MTATKHGLDLPARDDTTPGGGLIDDIKADLIALDHGSIYYSETTPDPSIIHDGFVWFNLTDSTYNYYHAPSLSWLLLAVGGDTGLAAHIASIPATHAADSITGDHIADLVIGSNHLGPASVIAGKIGVGGISAADQFAAGSVDDAAIGNRTVDQALAGGATNTGSPTSLLSWIAKWIKQIKGTTNWYDTPATDLATAAAHHSASAPHGGHSTPASVAAAISTHNTLQGAHGVYYGSFGDPNGDVSATAPSLYYDISGTVWGKTGSGTSGWIEMGGAMETPVSIGPSSGAPWTSGVLSGLVSAGDRNGLGNLAIAYPFYLFKPTTLDTLWVNNSAALGNVDVAVYDEAGAKIIGTGAVAQTNTFQVINVADTLLQPGTYYVALSGSDGSASSKYPTLTSTSGVLRGAGWTQMAAAHPLPATFVFALTTLGSVPMFGVGFARVL